MINNELCRFYLNNDINNPSSSFESNIANEHERISTLFKEIDKTPSKLDSFLGKRYVRPFEKRDEDRNSDNHQKHMPPNPIPESGVGEKMRVQLRHKQKSESESEQPSQNKKKLRSQREAPILVEEPGLPLALNPQIAINPLLPQQVEPNIATFPMIDVEKMIDEASKELSKDPLCADLICSRALAIAFREDFYALSIVNLLRTANVKYTIGKFEEADLLFSEAILRTVVGEGIFEDLTQNMSNLGCSTFTDAARCKAFGENFPAARILFSKASELFPQVITARDLIDAADVEIQLNDLNKAIEFLKASLKKFNSPLIMSRIASLYHQSGHLKQANIWVEKSLNFNIDFYIKSSLALKISEKSMLQYEALEKIKSQLVSLKKKHYPNFLILAAQINLDLGNLINANKYCEKAIDILNFRKKNLPLILLALAALLKLKSGDYPSADNYYSQILQNPSYETFFQGASLTNLFTYIGHVKSMRGDMEAANFFYNKAKQNVAQVNSQSQIL